ncbi:MAG: alpha/beta hydrolase [Calditrichaeota bacterium]|nr:alpha/beta hydrolase [Calditrichota bacterium]MCB0290384.1 alpha/beta hydrolase [Calditrichota bacterium]MCB0297088.1 alpha/beta hydrolase [Calditrichota bacterium]MCB0314615.1 alpha/beta hydrolase [Calditrichota bacterium]MCB9087348.1 alpha/beta hydrolase [Calditrichia bacterium]
MAKARIRIFYPLTFGSIVLRTENDWYRDVAADHVSEDRTMHEFLIETGAPCLNFKSCIRDGDRLIWSEGTNKIVFLNKDNIQDVYPHYFSGLQGIISEMQEVPSPIMGRSQRVRVYLPAGYWENRLKRYPVVYMHDGKNLFFPEEAFLGREWMVDENLDLLDSMNLVDQTIVVGIFAGDRMNDYTQPGYERYGRSLVEELKPWIDSRYRTLSDARHTGVMGSSLGGVVSFYLAWEWPQVFGNAACLSSTFSYQDDLVERVLNEPVQPRENSKFYLDSGWPGDNYEVTLHMANALIRRGFAFGRDVMYFAFPLAEHSEAAWSARCHLPFQLFSGKLRRAAEG